MLSSTSSMISAPAGRPAVEQLGGYEVPSASSGYVLSNLINSLPQE
jgi:hypothetical protein